jgi:hypothetical protein
MILSIYDIIMEKLQEVWKDVVGFEGGYMVSDLGRVVRIKPAKSTRSGRVLSPYKINGYKWVMLFGEGGKKKQMSVHQMVATVFCERPCANMVVNHLNGEKHDNRAANLEWVFASDNARHSWYILGTGEMKRLGPEKAEEIRQKRLNGARTIELANEYGVTEPTIRNIVYGRVYKK